MSASASAAMSPVPVRVLVVDDDADTRAMMVRLLRDHGFEVRASGTCEGALRCGQEQPVDLLVTDFLLPDGDGLKVLSDLRTIGPVEGILVSGTDRWDMGHVLDVAGPRFARQLLKPIHFEDLMHAVRDVLSERRNTSAETGRTAARIAAVREKVKVMTTDELNALSQLLRRRGEDLKEEVQIISEIISGRQATIRQQYPFRA